MAGTASDEFSDEYKDISAEAGSLLAKNQKFESKDKEYHHPDLYKYSADRPYLIDSLSSPWDGKQVWAIIDESGMWRQATVLAVCPPEEKEKMGQWEFLLDTKHDSWRHIVRSKPTDGIFLSFDGIQVTEYALLPGKSNVNPMFRPPDYFELLPPESPDLSVARGATPVHPWIADELRALRKLVAELKMDNERLQKELKDKSDECEERRLNEERLAKLLQKEKDERKIAEDKLNRQIAALKEIERDLNAKIVSLKDLINELQGEVNALTAKNEFLSKENAALAAAISELKQENEELNTLVAGCQNALRVSNKDKADLEEENRILRDRIQALDEALQKTIDSSNQSAHDAALRFAIEAAGMQAEIDRLRELLKGGAPVSTGVNQDDLELRRKLAMALKELEDKTDILHQSFEEVKRLKELLEMYTGVDWKALYLDLKQLSERCAALEKARGWKEGDLGPVALDDDDDMNKYRLYDGDEERAQKRKEKAERKKARALARLAAALSNEMEGVHVRIVELEKKLDHVPRSPEDNDVVQKASYPALPQSKGEKFVKVLKGDWLSTEMQLQYLKGQADSKVATSGDMEILQVQVAYLVERNQDLMDLFNGFPNGRPKWIPTYGDKLKGMFGSPYDGCVDTSNPFAFCLPDVPFNFPLPPPTPSPRTRTQQLPLAADGGEVQAGEAKRRAAPQARPGLGQTHLAGRPSRLPLRAHPHREPKPARQARQVQGRLRQARGRPGQGQGGGQLQRAGPRQRRLLPRQRL